jgi:hypothetical protein
MFGTTRGTKKKHPEVDAFLVYKLQDCGFSRIFGTTRGTKKKHPEVDAFFCLKIARLWILKPRFVSHETLYHKIIPHQNSTGNC